MQTEVEKGSKDSQKVRIIFQESETSSTTKEVINFYCAAHIYYIQPSRHPDVKAELALKVPGEE